MISCSAISSSGAAANYHLEKNGQQSLADGRSEYYQQDEVRSAWGGTGAAYAGLSLGGEISRSDFTRLLDGKVADFAGDRAGEERLLGRAQIDKETGERTIEHRAGWDFTFAAPKSVSIGSEVFGKEEIREAHETGVRAAMDFLERHAAQARVNGETVKTGNLVYAKFEHSISRDIDPQAHTHVIIANATNHEGKWYSLSNEKLLDLRTAADQIYKNEMARELQAKGYELSFDAKGGFEISSYSKEQLNTFSKRSETIDAHLRAQGIDPENATYSERQKATLDTRQGKDAPDSAVAQRGQWQEQAREHDIHAPDASREPLARDHAAGNEALTKALAHITEREAAFSAKDLYKASAQFSEGRATYAQLEKAISDAQRHGTLIERSDGKFTTREMVQAEKSMAKALESGRGAHQAVMTDREFDRALAKFEDRKTSEMRSAGHLRESERFQLKDEQRNAARMILTGNDRFQGVQGLAGTGKTTMLEFVREAAENKGWKVEGFSNGAAQAQKMEQESGIRSTTTARHLIDHQQTLKDAALAQRALATHEANRNASPATMIKPDFQKLEAAAKKGDVRKDFDSRGRAYYTDKQGQTWARGLYENAKTTTSANVNHLGLTETKYVIVQDKGFSGLLGGTTVIKSGGTLKSEAAGALRDKLHEATRDSKLAQFATKPLDNVLAKGEQWQKAGILESIAVRAKIALENRNSVQQERETLKAQASQVAARGAEPQQTLRIMDEASMSGQRQFNNVMRASQQAGARTVFLGDAKQHQGVEAGRAFEKAQGHMPVAKIQDISRQKTEHTKEAVGKIVSGQHAEAMKGLDTREVRVEQDKVEAKWANKIDGINAKLEAKQSLSDQEKADQKQYRDELKTAAKIDNQAVIKALAKDYAAQPQADRDKTLVVSSTNPDRTAINNAIRDELKASNSIAKEGRIVETYQRTDKTQAELAKASSFEKGEVVRFTSDYKSIGAQKGTDATVEKTDVRVNTVTVRFADGRQGTFQADKCQGREVYQRQEKEFSKGDRVAFTKNDKDAGLNNGDKGTVEKIEGSKMTVKLDSGQRKEIDTSQYKNIDHGYCSTSHAAQGQTVDKVMIHHNTQAGRHGDRETYVNVTRAREDAKVYTQNADKAAMQSGQQLSKEEAHTRDMDKPDARDRMLDSFREKGYLDEGQRASATAQSSEHLNQAKAAVLNNAEANANKAQESGEKGIASAADTKAQPDHDKSGHSKAGGGGHDKSESSGRGADKEHERDMGGRGR